ARERFGGDFRVMDLRGLEFPDDEFDGVFCSASIIFMEPKGMEKSLSEFRRVLEEDGILYVNFKIGGGRGTTEKWGSAVERFYVSMEEARRMLESAGFSIEREASPEKEEHSDFADFLCRTL
ncbi:MAG: class I SAM-dependent methyltransferase, partial [Candidatus Nanohaloarchaea archaeon]